MASRSPRVASEVSVLLEAIASSREAAVRSAWRAALARASARKAADAAATAAVKVRPTTPVRACCAPPRPAGVVGALARLGQPQQRAARELLLGRCEPGHELIGALSQRAPHAAGVAVALEREHRAAPALPQLQQRVLEQREGARLGAGVV